MAQPTTASDASPALSTDQAGIVAAGHHAGAEPASAHAQLAALTVGYVVREWDTSTLDESMRDGYFGYYVQFRDGAPTLAFPVGQSPVERLAAARILIDYAERPQQPAAPASDSEAQA
ncbi:hypothetical protein [Streptomyces sp. SID8352]|uniref:hypothetical protein n=1 Tax=Streptomyces sp. SID8352 TaxID=2690338 RepID=UPI00136E721B|nr:hypothetical protein [Streptomyces sp. SID8352]MYU22704.1 hypothetical protein [Streptomyces sp. SID8352]